jgi:hypothetical protein
LFQHWEKAYQSIPSTFFKTYPMYTHLKLCQPGSWWGDFRSVRKSPITLWKRQTDRKSD